MSKIKKQELENRCERLSMIYHVLRRVINGHKKINGKLKIGVYDKDLTKEFHRIRRVCNSIEGADINRLRMIHKMEIGY